MTQTLTQNRKQAIVRPIGVARAKSIIGIITYNTTTGQTKQCEITDKFWSNTSIPDTIEIIKYLFSRGYGLIRYNTLRYASLI